MQTMEGQLFELSCLCVLVCSFHQGFVNTSHDSKVHCAWGEYTTACCKMQSVVQRYLPAINDPVQHVSEEESGLIVEGGKLSKD